MEKFIDVKYQFRERLDKRYCMVDGITKEIPISYFGHDRDMNYIQDTVNAGEIELIYMNNSLS